MGIGGEAPADQGSGGEPTHPLKLKSFSFWTFNESGKFANFSEIWKQKTTYICIPY